MEGVNLNDIATILGVVLGVSGSILGILNYLRDRAEVAVTVKWDMNISDNRIYDPNKKWGVISVANIGRRSIFVSHAALRLPKGYNSTHLVLFESIDGKKLSEGDRPIQYMIDQSSLSEYAKDWRNIRAEITDSTGKVWRARKPNKEKRPSWAEIQGSR